MTLIAEKLHIHTNSGKIMYLWTCTTLLNNIAKYKCKVTVARYIMKYNSITIWYHHRDICAPQYSKISCLCFCFVFLSSLDQWYVHVVCATDWCIVSHLLHDIPGLCWWCSEPSMETQAAAAHYGLPTSPHGLLH